MTLQEVKKKIEEAGGDINLFYKFMNGQTVSGYPDGSINYYECDVERFIEYKCNPKNEPLEHWD